MIKASQSIDCILSRECLGMKSEEMATRSDFLIVLTTG